MANSERANRKRPRNRGTVLRVEDLRLERQALELKLGGASYRVIADAQGVSVSTAHDRVERALATLIPVEKAEQLRRLEAERLEEVGARLLTAVALTSERDELGRLDVDGLVKAATGYARVSERRSKLLGLDAPVEKRVTVTGEVDAAIEALVAELAGEVDPDGEPALVDP